jgi:predicted phage tail protein
MKPRQMLEAFWVADAMLIALALFFAIVGGALLKSPVFVLITLGAAALLAIHQLARQRHQDELTLAPDARRTRERRGF